MAMEALKEENYWREYRNKLVSLRLYLPTYWNCVLEQTSDVDRGAGLKKSTT